MPIVEMNKRKPFQSPAIELLQAQYLGYHQTVVRLSGQLKGVQKAIGIAMSKMEALEEALVALGQKPSLSRSQQSTTAAN